ncbi:hypothetical protein GIB67_020949 [Kingdonia uniflora]|uniref:RNase H type-1 domain-containing protein n=1 Tax=Kingdonia uniflora TaxID=39325 RepID=A0A7J7M7M0_9MAGN|nr:hypothetical protein GIB67_020949 [Kingdonia uniflora]
MKASRLRYSRRLQLIQAYTRDKPDLSFRCKRSNSTSRLELKQLNSLYSGRARPTSYRSIIGHEAAQAEDSEEAEAISVIRGMEAGQHMGLDRVTILTDCQRLVQAYRDRSDDLSWGALSLAPVMLAIPAQFRDFHFDFTERACNFEAHFLASRGARSPPFVCSVPSEATMFVNSILPHS